MASPVQAHPAAGAVAAQRRGKDNLSLISGAEDHSVFQRMPEDIQQRVSAHPLVSGVGLPKGVQPMTPGAAMKVLGWSQPSQSKMGIGGVVDRYMPPAARISPEAATRG